MEEDGIQEEENEGDSETERESTKLKSQTTETAKSVSNKDDGDKKSETEAVTNMTPTTKKNKSETATPRDESKRSPRKSEIIQGGSPVAGMATPRLRKKGSIFSDQLSQGPKMTFAEKQNKRRSEEKRFKEQQEE